MSKDKQILKLQNALILAKEMMIANDLKLPNTFEVMDEAIFYPYPEHNINGCKCWCEPTIRKVDGGSDIIIHRSQN